MDSLEQAFVQATRFVCMADLLAFGAFSIWLVISGDVTEPTWSMARTRDNHPTYGVAVRDGIALMAFSYAPILSNVYLLIVSTSSISTHLGVFANDLT